MMTFEEWERKRCDAIDDGYTDSKLAELIFNENLKATHEEMDEEED